MVEEVLGLAQRGHRDGPGFRAEGALRDLDVLRGLHVRPQGHAVRGEAFAHARAIAIELVGVQQQRGGVELIQHGLQEGSGVLPELCAEFGLAALRGVADVAGALEAAPAGERVLRDLAHGKHA